MSKEKTVEELAGKLDVIKTKIALIREINSAIRLYLTECKIEGVKPNKKTIGALKGDRAKLQISIMKMLGHEK